MPPNSSSLEYYGMQSRLFIRSTSIKKHINQVILDKYETNISVAYITVTNVNTINQWCHHCDCYNDFKVSSKIKYFSTAKIF